MARLGTHPTKLKGHPPPHGVVRLILPVYLPRLDGYFADGLRVLEASLNSLVATLDSRVNISLVNNGSAPEVAGRLDEYLQAGLVDRVVHNAVNRGKVDAVLSELRASYEPVLVVSDSDVVFRKGWVDALLAALEAFPECGLLSLHPAPDLRWHASSSALLERWTSTRLIRAPLVDAADLDRFFQSVGRRTPPRHPHGELAITRSGQVLSLGFAHFAFAIRREAVVDLPPGPSLSTANGAEVDFFELPADAMGWWCLSLPRALVHHVGNTLDPAEERRIREFTSQAVTDEPLRSPTVRVPRAARHVPILVRRGITRLAAEAERRGLLGRWLTPAFGLVLEDASAIKVRCSVSDVGGDD